MKRLFVVFSIFVLALSSCELEGLWEGLVNNDPSKGTEPMSDVKLGRLSPEDQELCENAMKEWSRKKKTAGMDLGKWPAISFASAEELAGVAEDPELSAIMTPEMANAINTVEFEDDRILCKVDFEPFAANLSKVTLTSSDESVVTFEKTDDVRTWYMVSHGVGECDVRMVAEGINKLERNYHLRIVGKICFLVYTDAFWLNNLTARLKYKTKSLPKGISELYMNVRDTATVIGMTRLVDQRRGEKTFMTVTDTSYYRMRQHTDRFRKGRRIILRNVSDAVKMYNRDKFATGFIRIDEKTAKALQPGASKISYSVRSSGEGYVMTILGQEIFMDRYQAFWINRCINMYGQWPLKGWSVVRDESDGTWYFKYVEPFLCSRVELGLDIIGNNPYIVFDVMMRRSQTPSDTDDDEEDPYDDFRDGSGEVVDSIGRQLKDYFVVTFTENLSQKQKDSLSRELDKRISETPDSLKWLLTY